MPSVVNTCSNKTPSDQESGRLSRTLKSLHHFGETHTCLQFAAEISLLLWYRLVVLLLILHVSLKYLAQVCTLAENGEKMSSERRRGNPFEAKKKSTGKQPLTAEVYESQANTAAHGILILFLLFPCWRQDTGHIRSEIHLAHSYITLPFYSLRGPNLLAVPCGSQPSGSQPRFFFSRS